MPLCMSRRRGGVCSLQRPKDRLGKWYNIIGWSCSLACSIVAFHVGFSLLILHACVRDHARKKVHPEAKTD